MPASWKWISPKFKNFLISEVPAGLPKSIQHCTRHYWHFLKKLSMPCFISISIYTLLTNQGNMIKSKIIKTWKYQISMLILSTESGVHFTFEYPCSFIMNLCFLFSWQFSFQPFLFLSLLIFVHPHFSSHKLDMWHLQQRSHPKQQTLRPYYFPCVSPLLIH